MSQNQKLVLAKGPGMDRERQEEIASEVRASMEQRKPPIDVLGIAREEGIFLAPSDYGETFDGRIEYHHKKGKFILFYPASNASHGLARVRFSVAHELGHYYLPAHRELLLGGRFHNSHAGFICDNKLEREADQFAAALLLPDETLADLISRRSFLTLKDLLGLASEWEASATCTVIRYVEYTPEPCAIILSRGGQILFYVSSEDAAYRGFQYLGHKQIPRNTATSQVTAEPVFGPLAERDMHSEVWFSQRRAGCRLWEEAFPLGYTGLVLTMLAFNLGEVEDD